MSSPARAPVDDGRPRVGSLLRLAHHGVQQGLAAWLTDRYADLQPAHAGAMQTLSRSPDGARLTTLAREARVTKQTMSALVEHLARAGYVERVPDPADGRASLIRATRRGQRFVRDARAYALRVEARLAEILGPRRLAALHEALLALNDRLPLA